jgi:glycosyltransferase 2 family protein
MSIGRHPRDFVVVFVAACIVVLCSMAAQVPVVNPVEVAIFEQFARIPEASTLVWRALTWVGGWVGIAAVTALVLYLKRVRLALQCAGAGVLAWGLVRVLDGLVGGRPVPPLLFGASGVRLPVAGSFAFPAPHAAVAAAMVAVVAPYLVKARYRGAAWALAVLVAAADVYLGISLPLGAFAGVFLGWGVGALFHLAWGAPGRRTSEAAVCQALERAGLSPVEAVPLRKRLGAPLEFGVTTETGDRLRVEVVRRLHRRGGPWYRLRRLLASLEVEDVRLSSPYHETEHEALVAVFAHRAGVNTPAVVLACETRHGAPLLVRRHVDGRRLAEMSSAEIDESLLDAIWVQIALLGEARIAHHDLRAQNVVVQADGTPWILNFTVGVIGASSPRTAQDIAETLVSLASRVGVERTVRSACRVLPPDTLEPALAYLQPLALPRRIRKQLIQQRYMLTDLRESLADRIDRPIPTFRSPVRPTTLVGLLLLGGAVYTLLPQLSSMQGVIGSLWSANWMWLAVATLCGFVAIVPSAISLIGSSATPLPFWRTNIVQLAAAFTGRTTPGGVGFFGINIAFMERLGIRRSSAVGVTMLNMAATGAIGATWGLIGVFGIGASGLLPGVHIPLGWPVVAAAAGVLVAATALLFSPFGRRRIVGPGLRVTRELLGVLRQPLRAVQLIGGVTGYLLISGLGLVATLAAFDAHAPVLAVIVVFVIGHTLGHIAPIPGGLGPTEALTIAGLTALGTAPSVAVATVLTMRLLTYWLPVLPGIATFRYLQHHGIV